MVAKKKSLTKHLFLFFQQLTDKKQRKETKHPKNHHFFGLMKRFSTTKIEFISTIEQK
jgi:hypothetical protein